MIWYWGNSRTTHLLVEHLALGETDNTISQIIIPRFTNFLRLGNATSGRRGGLNCRLRLWGRHHYLQPSEQPQKQFTTWLGGYVSFVWEYNSFRQVIQELRYNSATWEWHSNIKISQIIFKKHCKTQSLRRTSNFIPRKQCFSGRGKMKYCTESLVGRMYFCNHTENCRNFESFQQLFWIYFHQKYNSPTHIWTGFKKKNLLWKYLSMVSQIVTFWQLDIFNR